jgi:hypothetical protein
MLPEVSVFGVAAEVFTADPVHVASNLCGGRFAAGACLLWRKRPVKAALAWPAACEKRA